MTDKADIVIVGGGIAGTAVAANLAARGIDVLLLERQDEFQDICRGEWLSPWGIQEYQRLGLEEAFIIAGAWEIREWMPWDEAMDPDEVRAVDMSDLMPGIGGPVSFRHHIVCQTLANQAAANGARIIMGARKAHVTAGPEPSVRYLLGEQEHQVNARLVLGATGRAQVVGRQVGVSMNAHVHHWGAGMPIRGIENWPTDVQAMGTEGDVMFMVFPQGRHSARLYLNFATTDKDKYRGPHAVRNFLDAFNLKCLPNSRAVVEAEPDGPLVAWPSVSTIPIGDPVVEGAVMIGDEAGVNDSILGTGLSCALRDARIVTDLIASTDDWSLPTFAPYCAERAVRIARMQYGANIMSKLQAEFGEVPLERRRRARRMMADNPALQVISQLSMIPHEDVPEFGFNEFFAERLLA